MPSPHTTGLDWGRIESLFTRAKSLDGGAREAFIQEHCDGNARAARVLRRLLDHPDEVSALLDAGDRSGVIALAIREDSSPPGAAAADRSPAGDPDKTAAAREGGAPGSSDATRSLAPGAEGVDDDALWLRSADGRPVERIGAYRLIRPIGRGGMGMVFEAEQDHPARPVALKIISPNIASRSALRRFEHEAEILGRLQHPGIAYIYEAGTFDLGAGDQPYFAMELVHGFPITRHAERASLGTRQRLALMARVCEAVHYAHGRGVIHRDLKPGNILVTREGAPKVLDFGVARATDSDIQTTTLRTDIGQLVGTVPYMSPEQVTGDPAALDARSDVYALGVVCYELLAGRLPYDLRRKMVHEAVRVIREDTPTPLSEINRVFRGDIETIIGKALEKDPSRRYQSALELAQDIGRYLGDQPITARPPSAAYQFRKFARRNKALVGGVAAVFVTLAGGVAVSTGLAISQARARAEAERQRERAIEAQTLAIEQAGLAERARDQSLQIGEILQEMLAGAGPSVARGADSTLLRSLLDSVAARLDESPPSNPGALASLHMVLGSTYGDIGDADKAESHLLAAIAIQETNDELTREPLVGTLVNLAQLYTTAGRLDDADRTYQRALDEVEASDLGDSAAAVHARAGLGVLRMAQRRHVQAAAMLSEALEQAAHTHGVNETLMLNAQANLATAWRFLGRRDEARSLLIRTLPDMDRVLGADHPNTLEARQNAAAMLAEQGRYAEAAPVFETLLEAQRRVLGPDHPRLLTTLSNLGVCYANLNRAEDAAAIQEEVHAIRLRTLGPAHPLTLLTQNNLADAYNKIGRYSEARDLARDLLEKVANQPDASPLVITPRSTLGVSLIALGDYEEAERLLLLAYEHASKNRLLFGPSHPTTLETAAALADLYARWSKPELEAEWRARSAASREADAVSRQDED